MTRDSRPVAQLLPIAGQLDRGARPLDLEQLRSWRQRFWRTQPAQPSTGDRLHRDRAEDDG